MRHGVGSRVDSRLTFAFAAFQGIMSWGDVCNVIETDDGKQLGALLKLIQNCQLGHSPSIENPTYATPTSPVPAYTHGELAHLSTLVQSLFL